MFPELFLISVLVKMLTMRTTNHLSVLRAIKSVRQYLK